MQHKNVVRMTRGDIILVRVVGDQTYQTIRYIIKESRLLALQLELDGKPINTLVDLSQVGNVDLGARRAGFEALTMLHFDKTALYGASNAVRTLTNFILKASGQSKKARQFATPAEALQWLKT